MHVGLPGSERSCRLPRMLFLTCALLVGLSGGFSRFARAADFDDSDCLMCHDGSDSDIPAVSQDQLGHSVHEGFACTDCHADIADIPHEDDLAPVACGSCHEDIGDEYTRHGLGIVGVTDGVPSCRDCHGTHEILAVSDPVSPVNVRNLPQTCARCHDDINLTSKFDIKLAHAGESYETSVHGLAHQRGDDLAAVCISCHGTQGSAHRILPRGDTESAINHFNVPHTCGQCHAEEEAEYWEGIHGHFTLRGDTHAPVCTDCHGEHGILPPDDPRATVSPYRLAESTCTPCHDSARLNESFGLEKGRDVTFIDSYHGLKSRAGDTTVANCASCHGAHRILPSSDPRSSISPDSLQVTCGGCHTGISAKAAQVPIHAIVPEGKWPGLFRVIYTLLIVGVIGGMVGYVLLDYRRQYRESLRRPQIARMSKNAIIQHMLLFVSFTVLVITGLALRYSAHWPFQWLFGWDGGFGIRGTIHRCAAALFLFSVVWHVIYLFSREGRGFLGGMVPGRRDLVEVAQAIRYNLGLSREKPRFGRFSFVERAEYWALVWGTVVMAATGFALWFRNFVVLRFDATASFLEVMRVIHLYEAWLATLAILVWHFYGVIFKPGVYPGNPAWLTGSMPAEMHEEEHPGEHEEHGHRGGRDRHEDPAPAERKRREVRADAPV